MKKTPFILIFVFSIIVNRCFSQENKIPDDVKNTNQNIICDAVFDNSKLLFEEGKYEECISLLESSLNQCKFNKKKKELILQQITEANLEKDDLSATDSSFKKLLLNNPDYSTENYSTTDEFNRHLKNYYVFPTLAISLNGHLFNSNFLVSKVYSVKQNTNYKTPFISFINNGFYMRIERRIENKFSLYLDAGVQKIYYNRKIKNDNWQIYIYEFLDYAQLNFGLKRFFNLKNNLNFHIGSNIGGSFLYKNFMGIEETSNLLISSFENEIYNTSSKETFFNLPSRNKFNYFIGLTAGSSYKINHWFFNIEFNTQFFINTINNKKTRFWMDEQIEKFSYVDSDMRLINTGLSFGVGRYFKYKVKKK